MVDASLGAGMSIRPAEPSDVEAVIDVWLASTIPGQPFVAEADWRAQEPEVRDELFPIAETWVAEFDGEVVSFVSVIEDTIGGLFTRPEHQGQGYGRALVERVAQDRDPLFVEVFEVNTDAVLFYRHRGFVDHDRTVDERSGLVMLTLRMVKGPPGGGPFISRSVVDQ